MILRILQRLWYLYNRLSFNYLMCLSSISKGVVESYTFQEYFPNLYNISTVLYNSYTNSIASTKSYKTVIKEVQQPIKTFGPSKDFIGFNGRRGGSLGASVVPKPLENSQEKFRDFQGPSLLQSRNSETFKALGRNSRDNKKELFIY